VDFTAGPTSEWLPLVRRSGVTIHGDARPAALTGVRRVLRHRIKWPLLAALAAPVAGDDDHAISAGVTSTHGNNPSIASSLELRTGQSKKRLEWRLEADGHYSFDLDAEPRTVMSDAEVDGSTHWRLNGRWGVGLQLKAERNRPDGPSLRASLGPSVQLCLRCSPERVWAVTLSARREVLDASAGDVTTTTLVPATRLRLPLSATTTLEHTLELTVPSGRLASTRFDSEITLTLQITGRLAAVVDVDWEYDSRPVSGGHTTLVNSLKLKLSL